MLCWGREKIKGEKRPWGVEEADKGAPSEISADHVKAMMRQQEGHIRVLYSNEKEGRG